MDAIRAMLAGVLDEVRGQDGGELAAYIPELAEADDSPLGLAVVGAGGRIVGAGDTDNLFTIQSISKPFVFALAVEALGRDEVLRHVGVEPTGEPFNAISLEPGTGRPANPLINAGAIATTALIDGVDLAARDARILDGLSRFAGRALGVDDAVHRSESATGDRNRALAHLMRSHGIIDDVHDTVEAYFRQCSTLVTVGDLAVMAGTLAFGGRNPLTGDRVVSESTARDVVSIMTSCGMYDGSGSWLMKVGLPAKSGVSGGLIAVAPSQFGVGVFSPRLDPQGNSTRGGLLLERLSGTLGLHVFEQHEAIAAPRVAVQRDDDGTIRITVEGEFSFGGAEKVLDTLRTAELAAASSGLVVDLTGVSRLHPAARIALREELTAWGGRFRLED